MVGEGPGDEGNCHITVADATYSMVFAIYNSGGSQLWTETQGSVATSGGVYSVILG